MCRTEEALADGRDIISYIAERNVQDALRLEQALRACVERLTHHPMMYRSGRAAHTVRRWSTPIIRSSIGWNWMKC